VSQLNEPDQDLDALVRRLTNESDLTAQPPRTGLGRVLLYALILVVVLLTTFLLSNLIPAGNVAALAAILSGLAALALAILTAFLLVLNQHLIAATFRMAQATAVEAMATLAEARASSRQVELARQTVEAMQLDQEMAWRPYLMTHRQEGSWSASAVNVGRGPALRALYLERDAKDLWYFAGPKDVAVNQEWRFTLRAMPNPYPRELLGHKPAPDVVVVCCDQFGNWLRYEPLQAAPIVWRTRSGEPKADWVEWTETFGPGPDTPVPAVDAEGNAT
jgi:hypothetical protein